MISVLGLQRLTFLGLLIAINALMAGFYYLIMAPDLTANKRLLNAQLSSNQQKESEILEIKNQITTVESQKIEFEALENIGFFSLQNRSAAQDIFTSVKDQSGVINAIVNVGAPQAERDALADVAKHRIMVSEIEIEIGAFDDLTVFEYVRLLKENIPGHLKLNTMEIERAAEINSDTLQAVLQNNEIIFVKAKLGLSWRTLLPNNQIIQYVENPGEFETTDQGF